MTDWYKEKVLQTREDLNSLLRSGFLQREPLRLQANFAHLDEKENADLSRRLNRYYNACGCGEGRVFVLGALVCWCMYAILTHAFYWSWANAAEAFGWCLAGAFIGKAIGLSRAWLKLRRLVRAHEAMLQTSC